MDKVLPILEKHVQWIALGLGVLFLGLMAYSYLAQPPVTVPVAGSEVPPSEVDPQIAESPEMLRLRNEMSGGEIPPMPTVDPLATEIRTAFYTPVDAPVIQTTVVDAGNNNPSTPPPVGATATLPQAPAPLYVASNWGRGLFAINKLQPAPAPPPGGAMPEGGLPVVAPPVAAVPVQVEMRDLDWASNKFEVSLAQIADAFLKAGIDPMNDVGSETAFIGVDLIRQEKMVDGTWGPETQVPVLPNYELVMRKLPDEKAPMSEKYAYLTWAAQNVAMILQPPFLTPVNGPGWWEPGLPDPNQPQPGIVGEGGEFGGEGGFVPGQPPVGGEFIPGQPPAAPEFVPGGEGGNYGEGGYSEGGGYGITPLGQIPGMGTPDGTFLPIRQIEMLRQAAQVQPQQPQDIKVAIYGHDITVQPTRTYRYKLRYYLKNPLFGSEGASTEVREKLALASADSEWSLDVTIPARVEFFAKDIKPKIGRQPHDEVTFDVFVAKNNQWVAETLTVTPGDQIANSRSNWDSGWSVVDIRAVRGNRSRQYYMLLADANGQIVRRDVATDQASDRLLELRPPVAPAGEGVPFEGEGVPPMIEQ